MEAETDRALVAAAGRLVVLADATKWGIVGISTIARLDDADALITDSALDASARRMLTDRIGELIVTEPHAADGIGALEP
jgi:DeoR/GlpR family transcriptional regulator of sugar metabolism